MSEEQEQALRRALARAAQTPADPQARERALAAALAAYDQAQGTENNTHDQGNGKRARPIGTATEKGRNIMQKTLAKWVPSSVIAASLLVVVSVSLYQQEQLDEVVLYDHEDGAITDESRAAPSESRQEPSAPAESDALEKTRAPAKKESGANAADVVLEESRAVVTMSPGIRGLAQAEAPATLAPPARNRMEPVPAPGYQDVGRDDFAHQDDNPVHRVTDQPVSTFAVDVDTASYSFVRRQLSQGVMPQKDAVRVEEMINYFDYQYPVPDSVGQPFATHVQVMPSPWREGNKLLHIGLQGYELQRQARPRTNLVFLLDVSGSMNSPDKLPLVKQSLNLLLGQLGKDDRVAIAVYAGAAGTVLPPTAATDIQAIRAAMDGLSAGGSTAGGEGIRLAYQLARESFDEDAVNRVIIATDGDFNVGITDHEELTGFVERQREENIYLSVLGFGQGNYHDSLMQTLAQNGNGVAAYIDTLSEARKVLVEEATSALFPIANDVKIQVQFNPATVSEYRLIGYESRALAREDFSNDRVDAGDIGAGHSVTAIYEITPVGAKPLVEPGRYEQVEVASSTDDEYGFVRLRYKLPGEHQSRLLEQPVTTDTGLGAQPLDREARFATAVAGFAQLLRGGRYTGRWSYPQALEMAQANKGDDPYGYRTEFVQLIRQAMIAEDL